MLPVLKLCLSPSAYADRSVEMGGSEPISYSESDQPMKAQPPTSSTMMGGIVAIARWSAGCAMDAVRKCFGRDAVGYAIAQFDRHGSVPDAFRELAEKDIGDRET